MARLRNMDQSREIRARVKEILLRDWDPIGVGGTPNASDEYDAYASRAYVMVMEERATHDIGGYLLTVAIQHMGLNHRRELAEKSEQVAKLLVSLRPCKNGIRSDGKGSF